MIDKNRPPKYMRDKRNGRCLPYTRFKAHREHLEPWTGPLPWQTKEDVEEEAIIQEEFDRESAEESPEDGKGTRIRKSRAEIVADAVYKIDSSDYAKAAFGRPAMPKVRDVETLSGFSGITADEILEAMGVKR